MKAVRVITISSVLAVIGTAAYAVIDGIDGIGGFHLRARFVVWCAIALIAGAVSVVNRIGDRSRARNAPAPQPLVPTHQQHYAWPPEQRPMALTPQHQQMPVSLWAQPAAPHAAPQRIGHSQQTVIPVSMHEQMYEARS